MQQVDSVGEPQGLPPHSVNLSQKTPEGWTTPMKTKTHPESKPQTFHGPKWVMCCNSTSTRLHKFFSFYINLFVYMYCFPSILIWCHHPVVFFGRPKISSPAAANDRRPWMAWWQFSNPTNQNKQVIRVLSWTNSGQNISEHMTYSNESTIQPKEMPRPKCWHHLQHATLTHKSVPPTTTTTHLQWQIPHLHPHPHPHCEGRSVHDSHLTMAALLSIMLNITTTKNASWQLESKEFGFICAKPTLEDQDQQRMVFAWFM